MLEQTAQHTTHPTTRRRRKMGEKDWRKARKQNGRDGKGKRRLLYTRRKEQLASSTNDCSEARSLQRSDELRAPSADCDFHSFPLVQPRQPFFFLFPCSWLAAKREVGWWLPCGALDGVRQAGTSSGFSSQGTDTWSACYKANRSAPASLCHDSRHVGELAASAFFPLFLIGGQRCSLYF